MCAFYKNCFFHVYAKLIPFQCFKHWTEKIPQYKMCFAYGSLQTSVLLFVYCTAEFLDIWYIFRLKNRSKYAKISLTSCLRAQEKGSPAILGHFLIWHCPLQELGQGPHGSPTWSTGGWTRTCPGDPPAKSATPLPAWVGVPCQLLRLSQ